MRSEVIWPTIPAMLRDAARRDPAAEAVVDGSRRIDYATLRALVDDAARGLLAAGIEPGDRVAVWAPNSLEWIVAAVGITTAGGVLVPINTRFRGAEAAAILGRSSARVLFTVRGFLDTDYPALLASADVDLPALERTVLLAGETDGAEIAWADFVASGRAVSDADLDARVAAIGPDDPSDVVFTSGTTGMSKGVVMTHAQTLRAYLDWCDWADLRAGDRYLIANPFFHIFGYKAGCLACLMRGATIFPMAVFDAGVVLELVERERISVLPGPPTIYHSLLEHPDRATRDLASLRVGVTGAADIPVELIRRVREELPFERILTGYGLTEAGTVTGSKPDDDFEHIATTVGVPWPGFEVRIVVDGTDVATGEPGEVVVRGDTVTRGYLDDPEATAAAIDGDGWLHTGDLGTVDADGYLRIVGRIKDMFIVGGFNAYPAEIENLMLRHPDIAQVAVIGVPDERLGEVAKAFVVLQPGAPVEPETIVEWARAEMANFKAPRAVEIIDELPVNATGKVMKDELRAVGALVTDASEPFEAISYDAADADGVARITLHRPERLNAFTNRMQRELVDAFDRVDADADVRAVVVTGSGRGFCAGADLASGERTFSGGERSGRDPGGVVVLRIFECIKPVIAAVNGPAIGVGASMTLAMDARFAAPSATFGFVFTRLGIVPEACSSWFLPRLVGIPVALDWLMSGRRVTAADAATAGLVREVTDDVVAAATAYARDLVRGTAPVSVALTRQLVWRMTTVGSPADAHRVDSALLLELARAADAREGVAAFRERRDPAFESRVPDDLPDAYPWWEPDEWSNQ